jgi:hypothetical protein
VSSCVATVFKQVVCVVGAVLANRALLRCQPIGGNNVCVLKALRLLCVASKSVGWVVLRVVYGIGCELCWCRLTDRLTYEVDLLQGDVEVRRFGRLLLH